MGAAVLCRAWKIRMRCVKRRLVKGFEEWGRKGSKVRTSGEEVWSSGYSASPTQPGDMDSGPCSAINFCVSLGKSLRVRLHCSQRGDCSTRL